MRADNSPAAECISGFRLSPRQLILWRGHRKGRTLVSRARVSLRGPIDEQSLLWALEEIGRHSDNLRASFQELPGMAAPLQVIGPKLLPELRFEDMRGLSASERHRRLETAWADEPSFDLEAGRLLQATVFVMGDEDHLLELSAPAVVADADSLEIALRTLVLRLRGEQPPEASEIQFLHFSEWCLDAIGSGSAAESIGYWQAAAADCPPCPRLPFEKEFTAPPAVVRSRIAPAGETELLAAWAAILGRYCSTTDLVIWRRSAGRPFTELARGLGPMACYLPLHLRWAASDTFETFRERTAAVLGLAEEHGTFLDEGAWLQESRRFGFEYRVRSAHDEALDLQSADGLADFPLHLKVQGGSGGLDVEIASDGRLCDDVMLQRLLETLSATVAADQRELPVGGYVRLGQNEHDLVTRDWAIGPRRATPLQPIHCLIEKIAAETPEAPALRGDGEEITYARLDRASRSIAAALATHSIGRGSRVGVLARRSPATIVAMVGVLRAGAAFVPVDPETPAERIANLLRAADVRLVLTAREDVAAIEAMGFEALAIDAAAVHHAGEHPIVQVAPADPAYLIFTSGSTGQPKAVVVEHATAVNLAAGLQSRIYADKGRLTLTVNAPFTFDASIKQIVQLVNGHCLCVVPEEQRRSAPELLQFLHDNQVDVLDCTPSHLRLLLNAGLRDSNGTYPSTVLVGGESIDAETWTVLASHPLEFYNVYGPTEATVVSSVAHVAGSEPNIGRALDNVRLYITDDGLQPVPAGAVGEILIAGGGVARGYASDPGQTADRFIPDPFSPDPAARAYRTGDYGAFRPDGSMAFLGRRDEQVKIRGYRIEPGEVASQLLRHPEVRDAAVVPMPDEQGGKQLVAYFVPEDGSGSESFLDTLAQINANETDYLYQEIFVEHAYGSHGIRLPDDAFILDVGANIGMFSIYVARRCSGATVHAFEPIAPIFDALRRNVTRHAPNTHLHPFGLSDTAREEEFTFYRGYSMMSGQSAYADAQGEVEVIKQYLRNQQDTAEDAATLLDRAEELLAERFEETLIKCPLRRLSDVIDEQGIGRVDLLKIDVQRAELDVLLGLDERHWPVIQQVVMEVHDGTGTATQGRIAVLLALLEGHGFDVEIEQAPALVGTDRYNLYALRRSYVEELGPEKGLLTEQNAAGATPAGLRAYIEDRLPAYMVPSAFIEIGEIPLTRHGKTDVAALPRPDAARRELSSAAEPAANASEQAMVEVWKEVLGLETVGVTDNFFQLGGDSIRSIQIQALAAKRGLQFSLTAIFRHPTIRELLAHGDAQAATNSSARNRFELIDVADRARMPAAVEDAYPLAALQAGMIYHSELTGRPTTYHNVTLHKVNRHLDPEALLRAVKELADRHEILRTSFDLTSFQEPLQLVHERSPVPVTFVDLRDSSPCSQRRHVDELIGAEMRNPFNLAEGPLLRFAAIRTGEHSFQLMVADYHAALDGWSLHLLLDELGNSYERHLTGAGEPPPPLGIRYSRFVQLEGEVRSLEEAREYWRREMDGVEPRSRVGGARRDGGERETVLEDVQIEPELTPALERVSADAGLPLKSLLLGVHGWVLARAGNSNEAVTGLVVNGRPEEQDGDRLLGLFINMVPVRLPVRREQSWLDLARHAFEAEAALTPFRRMPLSDIQHLSRHPLELDTFFNFTHFRRIHGDVGEKPLIEPCRSIPVEIDFPLAVDFEIDSETRLLRVYFQYDTSYLAPDEIRYLAALYRMGLEACARAPDSLHSAVAPPPRPERDGDYRPHPEGARPQGHCDGPPLDDLEAGIARIWAETLGVGPVTRHRDFASLGGHSLLALRVRARLKKELDLDVPLCNLQGGATVSELASLVRGPRA